MNTNQHFTLNTDPRRRKHLEECVKPYNPANRHDGKATWRAVAPEGRWRACDYADLLARDRASLDLFWLKDDALNGSKNLPSPT